jgi:hypothetical protein
VRKGPKGRGAIDGLRLFKPILGNLVSVPYSEAYGVGVFDDAGVGGWIEFLCKGPCTLSDVCKGVLR